MALLPTTLQAALTRHFSNPARTALDAATGFAKIYTDYASAAQAGVALPVIVRPQLEASFRGVLLLALANPLTGTPATFANAWSTAIVGFWTAPPVVFAGAGETGVPVPLPSMAPTLIAAITALVAVPNAATAAAVGMANAIDAATRQFVVTLLPSGIPYPLA